MTKPKIGKAQYARLTKAANEALERDKQRKIAIEGRKPGPGVMMLVEGTAEVEPHLFWVGLAWHADDKNLLFCVPADENDLTVGSVDIATKCSSFPITLRCGFGTWFDADLLKRCGVTGLVHDGVCEEALDIVEKIVEGPAPYDPRRDTEDVDNWHFLVERAVKKLEEVRDGNQEKA